VPDMPEVDIAIVGFGPVGAVLAGLLGQGGVNVAVLERAAVPLNLPRATYFDREVMRIFQTAGYANQIQKITSSNRKYTFYSAAGEVLTGFDHLEGPTPWGMDTGFNFYQPDLEKILREAAQAWPRVDVRTGVEVTHIEQGDDHVTLALSGGERLRARWVVGCDGGASTVRRAVGIALEDLDFDEPWIVLDVFANNELPLPRDEVIQRCDPARPSTYIPSFGRHRRWEFMLLPGEDQEARVSPEGVAELLATWSLSPEDVEVVRSAVFRFHALLAAPWRRGRVLLAGDAAHQMPPFFGQGMCAGIRDAANLAWKLERVLRGTSPPELLDTYERERAPHVRSLIELSTTLGGIVCTTDPVIAAERDVRMRAEAAEAGVGPRPDPLEFIPALTDGLLHDPPAGDDSRAGHQFIQPLVGTASGQSGLLDDVVGQGFVLLGLGCDPTPLDSGLAAWWRQTGSTAVIAAAGGPAQSEFDGMAIIDLDGFLTAWLRQADAEAVLIRPDHYVFGVATRVGETAELVADLRRLLDCQPTQSVPSAALDGRSSTS